MIELNDLGMAKRAWCVGGDSNEILYSLDKNGRNTSAAQMNKFIEWVSDFGLVDVPLQHTTFTWTNLERMLPIAK